MSKPYSDQDYAMMLAGVFQAAKMTFDLAYSGHTDEQAFEASVLTLFQDRPKTVTDVYGGTESLRLGLNTFVLQLQSPQDRNPEITQYSIRLLQLGYQLFKDRQRLSALAQDIEDYQSRAAAFQFETDTKYKQLAKIYQDHISNQSPRIMVQGDPDHLQNPDTAARIRVALLAGIRSAFLWYQCGGKRWHLLTRQRRLLEAAREMLDNL